MSVYDCVDAINWFLDNGSSHKPVDGALQAKLSRLREKLEKFSPEPTEEQLEELIQEANPEMVSTKQAKVLLENISNDLKSIMRVQSTSPPRPSKVPKELRGKYRELMQSTALFRPIRQGSIKALGKSEGACLGFTRMMASSTSNIYNPEDRHKPIPFNREVHDFQRWQQSRKKDQGNIKETRLTRKHFCPDSKQRAEEIYEIASKKKTLIKI